MLSANKSCKHLAQDATAPRPLIINLFYSAKGFALGLMINNTVRKLCLKPLVWRYSLTPLSQSGSVQLVTYLIFTFIKYWLIANIFFFISIQVNVTDVQKSIDL